MDSNRAASHLAVIRTLMERTAIYRRALVPTTLWTGGVGLLAAILGIFTRTTQPEPFALYWLAISGIALVGALLLMRKQAMRDREPFWSPPARRVTLAMAPSLTAGVAVSVWFLTHPSDHRPSTVWLVATWLLFYGGALHSAGFFMPRGIRWFGWIFVALGALAICILDRSAIAGTPWGPHALMGATFGGGHLAYGSYLYLSKPKADEA